MSKFVYFNDSIDCLAKGECQMMKEINTRFGKIYATINFDEGEIVLYDSNKKYMDYMLLCSFEDMATERKQTLDEVLIEFFDELIEYSDIKDLLYYISFNYDKASRYWTDIAKYLKEIGADIEETYEDVINNDYVNIIGDYYVLMGD